jgi:hypothetical protein
MHIFLSILWLGDFAYIVSLLEMGRQEVFAARRVVHPGGIGEHTELGARSPGETTSTSSEGEYKGIASK